MTRICFVSYEIHPTVKGGCGVFLYNAARTLLPQGHEIIFLLDLPPESFQQFDQVDRLSLPCSHNCRAYLVESLTAGIRYSETDFHSIFEYRAYRFHVAAENLTTDKNFSLRGLSRRPGAGFNPDCSTRLGP